VIRQALSCQALHLLLQKKEAGTQIKENVVVPEQQQAIHFYCPLRYAFLHLGNISRFDMICQPELQI